MSLPHLPHKTQTHTAAGVTNILIYILLYIDIICTLHFINTIDRIKGTNRNYEQLRNVHYLITNDERYDSNIVRQQQMMTQTIYFS